MTLMRMLLTVLLAMALGACGRGFPTPKSAKSALGSTAAKSAEGLYGAPREASVDRDEAAADMVGPEPPAVPTPAGAGAPIRLQEKPTASLPAGSQAPPNPPSTSPKPPVANDGVESGQMLIYTAHLTMAVYQVEKGLAEVERIARELGGYLVARTDVAIAIRVPRAKFETAMKTIEPAGDVVHREIKAEDVTDEFFDLEVRLRNARAMRDRLAKLLQQAVVKEALDIEKELARVTEEIERIEGKLKLFRHRVAYSTIHVTFQARGATVETRPLRLPFSWLDELGLPHLLQLEDK